MKDVGFVIIVILAIIIIAIILWCFYKQNKNTKKSETFRISPTGAARVGGMVGRGGGLPGGGRGGGMPGGGRGGGMPGGGRGGGGMPSRGGRGGGMPSRGGRGGGMPSRGGRGWRPVRPIRPRWYNRPWWYNRSYWSGIPYSSNYYFYETPPNNYGNCQCDDDGNIENNCLYGNPNCDGGYCICGSGKYFGCDANAGEWCPNVEEIEEVV